MKRIDSLKPGTQVTVRFMREYQFGGPDDEKFFFHGILGEGDDRRAVFGPTASLDQNYRDSWEAYRFNGRWAYGSSAETLRLVAIHEPKA